MVFLLNRFDSLLFTRSVQDQRLNIAFMFLVSGMIGVILLLGLAVLEVKVTELTGKITLSGLICVGIRVLAVTTCNCLVSFH